jgi:hypothetical protein
MSAFSTAAVGNLLPKNVAEDAPLLSVVVGTRAVHLVADLSRDDRQRDDLQVRVLYCRTSRGAVVLENDDGAKALVSFQVLNPLAACPERFLDGRLAQRGERLLVPGRFDDHLVRADAVHLVENPLALPIERPFHTQHGNPVRHDPQRPARRVGCAPVASEGEQLSGRHLLVSFTEGTRGIRRHVDGLEVKVGAMLSALG